MQTPKSITASIAVIASGLALLNTVTAAYAGPGTAPKHGSKAAQGKHMGGRMLKELNLTESQTSRIKTIQADATIQRKAISGNSALTQDQKKSQMKTLAASTMSKMMAILTPEQKQTLQKMMTERLGKMTKMHAKKGVAPASAK